MMDPENQQLTTTATSSFLNTCFNGLNALSGIGIITVPYALAAGGWLSLLLLFTIAVSTFYTGLLIKRCMDTDPTLRSYPDIGYRAFGKTGRIIVLILINMELYLVATGFLIMEGDNLSNLFPQMDLYIFGIHVSSKKSFVIIVAAIILPTTWLNDMRILSYLSASGVLASLIVLGAILWVGMFDGVGFEEKCRIINWNGMPSAISLYAFCYGAHPVFPTLYTSMRNKHQFSKVLLVTDYAKPSYRQKKLRSGNIHHPASIILPSTCYLKISGTYRVFGLELVLIGFIVFIGILVAIMGTYTSLADIVGKL
ncbi:hypothetical protein L1987_65519 [Smallanthus sonchifolius]|uniref:Uncharacterized protein n=1 Tax=Smallanthus sonchifolius TaxID=185202 RepID=A0ACB9BUS4_9ASTR|nr:hypothetical protein L1987_65519 [Smallanthus sonchifolius]